MSNRLRALLQLVRLPALFTAWSNILAAHLIATQGAIDWQPLMLLVLASSGLYLGGMVLNDCFDLEEDRRERPQRPLPSGRIAIRSAWTFGFSLLALGLFSAALVGTQQLAIAVLLMLTILAYDGWLKAHAVGTLVMGSCRYLNWLLGLSVAPLDITAWLLPIPIFLYITSVTILSRGETEAASKLLPRLCLLGVFITGIAVVSLLLVGVLSDYWALIPGGVFMIMLLRSLGRNLDTPERVQHGVKILLLGVIPLDALLVVGTGLWWESLLVLTLLIPGRLLAGLIYVT